MIHGSLMMKSARHLVIVVNHDFLVCTEGGYVDTIGSGGLRKWKEKKSPRPPHLQHPEITFRDFQREVNLFNLLSNFKVGSCGQPWGIYYSIYSRLPQGES